jgi:hypothetical protein
METPKVRLSNIDRGIGLFTAVNSYQSRKLNEQILVQQFKNNNHLSDLKRQMNEANTINRQILANQLKEEEHKETQKYYKALSFNLNETIEIISKINDDMVLNYVLSNYYDKLLSNIIEANDRLDEISDKTYTKNTLENLKSVKIRADGSVRLFQDNVLSKIDNLISDFKKKENMLKQMAPPQLEEEIITRKKIDIYRTAGIIILAIPTFFFLLCGIISSIAIKEIGLLILFLFIASLTGLPFIYHLRAEIKWRKEYKIAISLLQQKREEFQSNKLQLERKYEEDLQIEKNNLMNHPLYNAMQEINEAHPTFDHSLSNIVELEVAFDKKWNYKN